MPSSNDYANIYSESPSLNSFYYTIHFCQLSELARPTYHLERFNRLIKSVSFVMSLIFLICADFPCFFFSSLIFMHSILCRKFVLFQSHQHRYLYCLELVAKDNTNDYEDTSFMLRFTENHTTKRHFILFICLE